VHINVRFDAMKSYLQSGNTAPTLWVDLAKTYLKLELLSIGKLLLGICSLKVRMLRIGCISKRHLLRLKS
jgi:hypothetical protein